MVKRFGETKVNHWLEGLKNSRASEWMKEKKSLGKSTMI